MKTIKTARFAAREPIIPIFWHDLVDYSEGDFAVLIEQPISEYYYLNNSIEIEAKNGYRDYRSREKVLEVIGEYKQAFISLERLKGRMASLYLKALFNISMVKVWKGLTDTVANLIRVYKFTEPARFEKIEKGKKTEKFRFATEELTRYRFILKKKFLKLEPYIRPLFGIIALRYGIKKDEFLLLDNKEMLGILEGRAKPKPDILNKRKHFAILKIGKKKSYLTGQKFFDLKKHITKLTVDKKKRLIRGMGVTKGKAKGRARILIDYRKEFGAYQKRFKKGDIIVTGMTQPDITILLGKASAIVTEEGSMTCHAAIISRESGTPCVVGTGPVTKIFKDGEMIEVDADRGVVRRL